MTATALIAVLVTAGAGAMGYPAIRDVIPAEASHPIQEPPVAQAPPRPAATKPAADQGPVDDPGRSRRSGGPPSAGGRCRVMLWYSRSSGKDEPVIERTKTDNAGHAQVEVARERRGAKLGPHRLGIPGWPCVCDVQSCFSLRKSSPAPIQLTLSQPAKWTITVLSPDDRPIGGLRLMPHSLRRTEARSARNLCPLLMHCSSR